MSSLSCLDPWLQRLVAFALWLVALVFPSLSAAQAPPVAPLRVETARVELTVYRGGEAMPDGSKVSRRGSIVHGVVRYALSRPAERGETLRLLDFSAFLREDPKHLDEVTLARYVDGPFDAGELIVTGAWGAGGVRREGQRRDLILTVRPGARSVTLRYRVKVPHRFWPFGCVRRRCSLSGALAPLPSAPAQGGRSMPPGRVVQPVRWYVDRAELATPGALRTPSAVGPKGRPSRRIRAEELFVVGGRGELAAYPSVFWGPRFRRLESSHRGVNIDVRHMLPRPFDKVPHDRGISILRDVPGQLELISGELVDLLDAAGYPQPVGTTISVIQGPLRSALAEAHPGVVLVSDQAMEIFPAKRFLKFHIGALGRAILDMLLLRHMVGRRDPSSGLWVPGSVAFALLGVWQEARAVRDEFAGDILRNFTFVPAVDRFLYTQQASFSQSYFRGVEDEQPLRNHPLWFAHELPTGRRIHEKLTDTIGLEALRRFYEALVANPGADARAVAAKAYGHTLGWFFDQWLGPYPSVDYLIESVKSEKLADGSYRHHVTIQKNGERPVIEPVQVLVTERGGKTHYLVWNGQLSPETKRLRDEPRRGVHTFELRTASKIKHVRLDPRHRLLQTPQAPRANVDPRFNDRKPPKFRFLYTGVGFSVAFSEFLNAATPFARFNALSGFISFESSLRRDLRRTGHLIVAKDRETFISVGAGTNFWFGSKVNNQRRRSRVRFFVTTSWLSDRTLDPRGGVRVIERLALIDDTRRFAWWPERGRTLALGVSARQTARVDDGPRDHRYDFTADAGWVQLWPLAHDHVIATSVGAGMVFPVASDPEFRQLTRVGGIGGLSGYLADEIFGLATASAQVEYRHVFVNNLHWNLLNTSYLRSLGGVLSAGTATSSACESFRGWFGRDSWYGSIGYGLTAYLSILGVTPQIVRVDVSVPLVRRNTECLGEQLPDYLGERQGIADATRLLPPYNINFIFQHTF